ncbi:MAG: signal peptidase I [Dehalococcoidia bacterium]
MKRVFQFGKMKIALVVLLLLGAGYLGLVLSLGTSSPFLLVRGTSMEPTFHEGDLLLKRSVSPAEVKVGDVIVFNVPSDARERLKLPSILAHRIVDIEGDKSQGVLVTQGDNSDVDPFKVPSSNVRGVVVKNLGPIGWPILFLANKSALILGVFLMVGLPILTFVIIALATLWFLPHEKGERPMPEPGATEEAPPIEVEKALGSLSSAIAEYAVHLRSHTEIIKNMGGATQELEQAAERQNEVLTDLTEVVKQLNGQQKQADDAPKLQAPATDTQKMPEQAAEQQNEVLTDLWEKYIAEVVKQLKGQQKQADDVPKPQALQESAKETQKTPRKKATGKSSKKRQK